MSDTVLLFPGQGAQKPGMGRDVVQHYFAAAQTFEQAADASGMDLEHVCFDATAEELARTDVCQVAILTVSVAVLRAIEQELNDRLGPPASAGLSLGEYTALVAAEALEFGDAVRLVQRRGELMQAACHEYPGTMYSIIGLTDRQVEDACRRVQELGGKVWPANYNSPGQLVISGEAEAAAEVAKLCSDMGARRALQLDVAGAFHSPLMQPAADALAQELDRTDFRTPSFPVVANIAARPAQGPDDVRGLLARQLTSPVKWAQSMAYLIARGHKDFIEVGPGRVLQGLMKRIDADCRCTTVCSPDAIAEVCAAL